LNVEAMRTLPVLLLFVAVWGCRSQPSVSIRRWHRCTCQYVTDFDGPGRIDVDVCSAGNVPAGSAESCAQSLGVGAVSACRCAEGDSLCQPGDVCREARAAFTAD